jgi:hypothetical protein
LWSAILVATAPRKQETPAKVLSLYFILQTNDLYNTSASLYPGFHSTARIEKHQQPRVAVECFEQKSLSD